MLLGTLLDQLRDEDDAAAALEALGDIVLLTNVGQTADAFGETPGEYTSGAVRRFAGGASNDAWLALMSAMERASDPARTTLAHMVRWALARDAAELEGRVKPTNVSAGCTCGSPHA